MDNKLLTFKIKLLTLLLFALLTVHNFSQNITRQFNTNERIFFSNTPADKAIRDSIFTLQQQLYEKLKQQNKHTGLILHYYVRLLRLNCTYYGFGIVKMEPFAKNFNLFHRVVDMNIINDSTKHVDFLGLKAHYAYLQDEPNIAVDILSEVLHLDLIVRDTTKLIKHLKRVIVYSGGHQALKPKIEQLVNYYLPMLKDFSNSDLSKLYHTLSKRELVFNATSQQKAYGYITKALEIGINLKDTASIIRSMEVQSDIHQYLREDEKALKIIKNAVKIAQLFGSEKLKRNLTTLYLACGQRYLSVNQLDSSEYYFILAKINEEKYTNDCNSLSSINLRIVELLIAKESYQKALGIIIENIDNPYLDSHLKANFKGYLPDCFWKTKKLEKAISYGLENLEYAIIQKNYQWIGYTHDQLSQIYEETNELEQALYHSRKEIIYYDSLYNMERENALAHLEADFELKIQQYENICLQEDLEKTTIINQKKQTIIQKNERIKAFLLVTITSSVLLLSSIILLLSLRNRSKKRVIRLNESTIKQQELREKALNNKLRQLKYKMIRESSTHEAYKQSNKTKTLLSISKQLKKENNWLDFMLSFDEVYNGFTERILLTYPDLSKSDIKIIALSKLNLTRKEIAELMAVTDTSITKAKTRLRIKLGLKSTKEIPTFINNFIQNQKA